MNSPEKNVLHPPSNGPDANPARRDALLPAECAALFHRHDMLAALLSKDGSLLDVNGAGLKMMDASGDECGQLFWAISWWQSTGQAHLLQEAISRCADGEYCSIEATGRGVVGPGRTIHFTITPVIGESGEVRSHLVLGHDISATRNTIDALSHSERKFRAIFNQSVQLMGVLDTDGTLLEVNTVALKLAGVTATEVLGRPFWETVWWRHSPELIAKIREGILKAANGENVRFEAIHLDGGQSPHTIEFSLTPVKDEEGKIIFLIPVGFDVSERKRIEQQLSLDASVLANTTDGIIVTDVHGIIEMVNPAFTAITGYSADEAIGANPRILKSGRQPAPFYEEVWRELSRSGTWNGEFWNKRKNGEIYVQESSLSAIRDAAGQVLHYIAVFRDVTERKKVEETLQRLSSVDGLTGLANRRVFDDLFAKEWRRALRDSTPLSLILADVDFFKNYNDRYGHLQGDDCLRTVAATLARIIHRPGDLAARFGGEEFIILLPGTGGAATGIAEKICGAIESLGVCHESSSVSPVVTLSLGVATTIPSIHADPQALLEAADQALYRAKSNGRNRVETAPSLPETES